MIAVYSKIMLANVNSAVSVELEACASRNNVFYKSTFHWIRCSSHIINNAIYIKESLKIELLTFLDDILKPYKKNLVSIIMSFLLTYK